MKLYKIMDYCYGKNPLHFGVDTAQSGQTINCNVVHLLLAVVFTIFPLNRSIQRVLEQSCQTSGFY